MPPQPDAPSMIVSAASRPETWSHTPEAAAESLRWAAPAGTLVRGLPILGRRLLLIGWDCLAWVLALLSFLVVRYDFSLSQAQWSWVLIYTALALTLQVAAGIGTLMYLGRHPIGSFREATWLGATVLMTTVPLGLLLMMVSSNFPRGVALMMPPLALLFMASGRWAYRALRGNPHRSRPSQSPQRDDSEPELPSALVYGAGDAGHQVARLVDRAEQAPYKLVGFVDDDPAKRFLRVRGYKVLGVGRDVIDVAREHGADKVIMAVSDAPAKLMQSVADRCQSAGIQLVVVPPVREMIGGQVTLGSLREFNVADLLGRRPIETDVSGVVDYITGKVVLVTGAGGSIGSELARQVHQLGPAKLILLDRDESALHSVQLSIYGNGLLDSDDMVLCDIRDIDALRAVFTRHRPQVVFHAAALKHLPLLERYPAEGWKTNVLGTNNVLRCAREVGVQNFVNISTDKAADATSVLGQTKRVAEQLTSHMARETRMPYVSVRFGNVLGSRGSVLHTFRAQIEKGGPITVTHPDVTRFFMTIPEACQLVLQAGAIGRPGDALVLDMGEPVKIVDVAKRLIAESGRPVDINYTGLRHGEKMHEVLFSGAEAGAVSDHPLISQVPVPALPPEWLPSDRDGARALLAEQAPPRTLQEAV